MLRNPLGSPSKSTPDASAPPDAPPTHKRPISDSVLGAGARLEGKLDCQGNIRIDGTFVGDIAAQGRVALTDQAVVEGDIIGEAILVGGFVRGDITARSVSLLRTGRVIGDLRLERLATEEGSFLQGNITMEEKLDIAAALSEHAARKPAPRADESAGVENSPSTVEPQSELEPDRTWGHRTYRPR